MELDVSSWTLVTQGMSLYPASLWKRYRPVIVCRRSFLVAYPMLPEVHGGVHVQMHNSSLAVVEVLVPIRLMGQLSACEVEELY